MADTSINYGVGGGTNATIEDLWQDNQTRRYFDTDFHSTPYAAEDAQASLAYWVIEDVFGLQFNGDIVGSNLPAYDINNRDAYSMIQLSLADELKDERIYECYADGEGNVHFYHINNTSADLGTVYYSVETTTFRIPCDNVLVYGYDPPPTRLINDKYDLFTLVNGEDYNVEPGPGPDGLSADGPWYYVYGDVFPNCGNFKEGWIEYNKIDWGDPKTIENTGLYNKYNWEELITYAYNIQVPFFQGGSTSVKFMQTSTRIWPLGLGYDGVVYTAGVSDISGAFEKESWIEDPETNCRVPVNPTHSLPLPYTDTEKFVSVKDIIIYGYKFDHIFYLHDKGADVDPTPYVMTTTKIPDAIKLRRGTDYVVNDDGICRSAISFFSNVKTKYAPFFAKKNAFKYHIHPQSVIVDQTKVIDPSNPAVIGKLKDNISDANIAAIYDEGPVFPLNEGQSGYLILEMYVLIEWDNPRMHFTDERDEVTLANLKTIVVDVLPIIKRDAPAPIGHNGKLLDQTATMPDDDPTTYELWNLTSDYQQVFDSLEKGDIKVTLPFLNEEEAVAMSGFIQRMKQEQINIPETVYVCGPDADPKLGDKTPDGGVVSDITYSYQDSSQYTITVQASSAWRDVGSGWNTSINMAKTERLNVEGVVISAAPNNSEFVVHCEKMGPMPCLNLTKEVIAQGDKVQVTIYNNPQGEN